MPRQSFRRKAEVLLFAAALTTGCGSGKSPTPSPGISTGETITGRERIGWDQPASSSAELSTFRYAIYVDGTRSEIAETVCSSTAAAGGFPCSGRLPSMSAGTHVLEIAAFIDAGGIVEGGRSAPLQITVLGFSPSGSSAPSSPPLTHGELVTTSDRVELTASLLAEGLDDVTDLSVAPDGRLFIAERGGRILIRSGASVRGTPENPRSTTVDLLAAGAKDEDWDQTVATAPGLLTAALSPDFAQSGHVFLMHSEAGMFRLSRYRLIGNQLVERMGVVRDVPASPTPAAVLRFGSDSKLYAAFDDGGSRDAAARLSEWSGKILRLNPDGRTPADQPAASPVFWTELGWPRGLDWSPEGVLWMAEQSADGSERIRGLATVNDRPLRAGQRVVYALPPGAGAASIAFYRAEAVPQFRGNMFVGAREGGYLLRIQFDEHERTRAVTTEKLLEGRIGSVRSIVIGPDGALYCATDSAVWRLAKPQHEIKRPEQLR